MPKPARVPLMLRLQWWQSTLTNSSEINTSCRWQIRVESMQVCCANDSKRSGLSPGLSLSKAGTGRLPLGARIELRNREAGQLVSQCLRSSLTTAMVAARRALKVPQKGV